MGGSWSKSALGEHGQLVAFRVMGGFQGGTSGLICSSQLGRDRVEGCLVPWGLGVSGGEGETFEEFGGTLCLLYVLKHLFYVFKNRCVSKKSHSSSFSFSWFIFIYWDDDTVQASPLLYRLQPDTCQHVVFFGCRYNALKIFLKNVYFLFLKIVLAWNQKFLQAPQPMPPSLHPAIHVFGICPHYR